MALRRGRSSEDEDVVVDISCWRPCDSELCLLALPPRSDRSQRCPPPPATLPARRSHSAVSRGTVELYGR
ncbi:unnamed protein product [Arctogadus glacialis]